MFEKIPDDKKDKIIAQALDDRKEKIFQRMSKTIVEMVSEVIQKGKNKKKEYKDGF
jgi:hypothetical protein